MFKMHAQLNYTRNNVFFFVLLLSVYNNQIISATANQPTSQIGKHFCKKITECFDCLFYHPESMLLYIVEQ